jgi:hypothetical protein
MSVEFPDGRVEKVRVKGDAVIGFAVYSEVLEFVGAALQQGRRWGALGPNDHLAHMPLTALLDLVAHTVVCLFVANDVTAQHSSHDTLELFPNHFFCFFTVLYFLGFRMTRIRYLVLVIVANLR